MSLNTNTPSKGTKASPSRTPARHSLLSTGLSGTLLRLGAGPREQSSSRSDLLRCNLQRGNRPGLLPAGNKTQKKRGLTRTPSVGLQVERRSAHSQSQVRAQGKDAPSRARLPHPVHLRGWDKSYDMCRRESREEAPTLEAFGTPVGPRTHQLFGFPQSSYRDSIITALPRWTQ